MPHKDWEARRAYANAWKAAKLAKLKEDPVAYEKAKEQERARVQALNADPERAARNRAWALRYRQANLEEVRARDRARAKGKRSGDRKEYAKTYYQANREKQLAAANAWNAENRERNKETARRNRLCRKWPGYYDLPENARCAGCDKTLLTRKEAHADHCHEQNIFRGWLCRGCNHALGNVSDNPAVLRKLADYLERHADPEADFKL